MIKFYVSTCYHETEDIIEEKFPNLTEENFYSIELTPQEGAKLKQRLGLLFNPTTVLTGKFVTKNADKILELLNRKNLYVTKNENGIHTTPEVYDEMIHKSVLPGEH